MPKTGDKCTFAGYYKFSGHIDRSIRCHPTFDEHEILMSNGDVFPSLSICIKDAFWTYDRRQ
jgi:hypothetical protein